MSSSLFTRSLGEICAWPSTSSTAEAHLPGWSGAESRPGAVARSVSVLLWRRTSFDPREACFARKSANIAPTSKPKRAASSSRTRLTSETIGSSHMTLFSHQFLRSTDHGHAASFVVIVLLYPLERTARKTMALPPPRIRAISRVRTLYCSPRSTDQRLRGTSRCGLRQRCWHYSWFTG